MFEKLKAEERGTRERGRRAAGAREAISMLAGRSSETTVGIPATWKGQ
jgi:hypothetical protein